MAIQKITPSFRATLKGNSTNLIKTCVNAGLNNAQVKNALNVIHRVCPKKEDNVYLYYREMYNIFEDYVGMRSGIKVVKDGKVMEKNIDPYEVKPKYLLNKFASNVRDLVSGKIKPDETIKIYP